MREFNLEEAKAGKPVCDRRGNDVRIICFDAKSDYPIICLVETEDNIEEVITTTIHGRFLVPGDHMSDLMMKI
jgi:recombinational DNA repair protein RecR